MPPGHQRPVDPPDGEVLPGCRGGATGFIFANEQVGCLPATGNVGSGDGAGAIPAVGVSRELGSRLARTCERGPSVTLTVDCENERTTSQSVTATLGPETGPEVLVTAHHDAHDISEGDRQRCGLCGRHRGGAPARDRHAGSRDQGSVRHLRCRGAPPSRERGVGRGDRSGDGEGGDQPRRVGSSRDPVVSTHGIDAIGAAFEATSDDLGVPIELDDGPVPGRPVAVRLPRYSRCDGDGKDDGDALRGWGHTHADTLDKVDRRDLRALAVPTTAAVTELLAAEDVDRRSPEEIREAAVEEGHAEGMRMTGVWPWESASQD